MSSKESIKFSSDDAWLGISILQCYFPDSDLIVNKSGIYITNCKDNVVISDKFKLFLSGWDYDKNSQIWFWIGETKCLK